MEKIIEIENNTTLRAFSDASLTMLEKVYSPSFAPPGIAIVYGFLSPAGDDEVLIVPTAETVKQSFFLELALAQEMAFAIVGHTGTGKSFVTNSFIRKLCKDKYITNVINFSARTTVNYTQVKMHKYYHSKKNYLSFL